MFCRRLLSVPARTVLRVARLRCHAPAIVPLHCRVCLTRWSSETARGGAPAEKFSDQDLTWVDRNCPPGMQPYLKLMRVDRPTGVYLLAWPCFWSIAMAAPPGQLPDLQLMALFGAGAFVMRSAGCIINDLWDRDIDRRVARTQSRPLASGALSVAQAVALLGANLGAGLAVLLQLNDFSIALGASSLGLVVMYPLMKRVTNWPQLVLGLTFNWGALLGWAAVHGACDWATVLPLYAGGVCWTIVYDTLYAHQDTHDDRAMGLGSTALLFGESSPAVLSGFSVATASALGLAGWNCGLGLPYFAALAGAAGHLAWQVRTMDTADARNLSARFRSNNVFGLTVLSGIVASNLFTL
eukprot:g6828.t1